MLMIQPRPKNKPKSFTMPVIILKFKKTKQCKVRKSIILITLGEGKIGTDENAFVDILAHAGQRQAYLIFQEYKKISGKTIEQAMNAEMSGELLSGLLAIGTFIL